MAPDSTASASKIVGVSTFKKPVVVDDAVADQHLLIIEGTRCHMPYIIKVSEFTRSSYMLPRTYELQLRWHY